MFLCEAFIEGDKPGFMAYKTQVVFLLQDNLEDWKKVSESFLDWLVTTFPDQKVKQTVVRWYDEITGE